MPKLAEPLGLGDLGRRWVLWLSLAGLMSLWFEPAHAQVAVVADGLTDQVLERHQLLARELSELSRDRRRKLELAPKPSHVGDFTLAGARKALAAALEDPETKVVVGFGYFVGVAAAELSPYPPKPVLLAFGAPEFQGLPEKGRVSGRRNLSYLTGLLDFEKDLERFREVIEAQKVAFLVDEHILPEALKRGPKPEEVLGEDVMLVPMPTSAESAVQALPEGTEAVYLPTHFRMSYAQMTGLIDSLNERRLPTYAAAGPAWVEKGAFVTLVPPDAMKERFRRLALYVRDAVAGDNLAEISIRMARRTELLINLGTARRIGIFPKFELMTEARLVRPPRQQVLQLRLVDAVETAVADNPSYRATLSELQVAEAQLREARGELLPSLDATANFDWIDEDVATEFGDPERQLYWGLTLGQVIYAPLAVQSFLAQQKQVDSLRADRREAELDLVLEVIQSFFNVLQSKAIEVLNRDNLRQTRTNRALAELRVEIGTSERQDVARWDISLADGRVDTISATADRNRAEIDLNRILNVDLERSFEPVLPEGDPVQLLIGEGVSEYVDDLQSFRIFRDFMAKEALKNSPEIESLDALIEVQDKLVTGYELQLFVPNISLGAGFTNVLDRSGRGAGSPPIEGFPPRDDFTWNFGIGMELNLFSDTRYGTLNRFRRTRDQFKAQRDDLVNRVQQEVRAALHQAGASRAAVGLREDAVRAARINLESVTSGYREGKDTIITLIDAQNQSLSAEINSANAVYQFLSDFAAVQRAAGQFLFRRPPAEQQDFMRRLEAFAAEFREGERNP